MSTNLWTEPAHAQRYLRDRSRYPHREEGYTVLCELLPERVERALDLGCGDGEVAGRIASIHPDAEIVALDFSAEMLERARARFAEHARVRVVEHDLMEPLDAVLGADERFDVVASAFAIHHTPDARKRSLTAEVLDRLRPGGVFVNLEHVASPTPELHREFLLAFGIDPAHDDPSNQLAPVEDQLAWMRAAGFQQVDCLWKYRELALLAARAPA